MFIAADVTVRRSMSLRKLLGFDAHVSYGVVGSSLDVDFLKGCVSRFEN